MTRASPFYPTVPYPCNVGWNSQLPDSILYWFLFTTCFICEQQGPDHHSYANGWIVDPQGNRGQLRYCFFFVFAVWLTTVVFCQFNATACLLFALMTERLTLLNSIGWYWLDIYCDILTMEYTWLLWYLNFYLLFLLLF